MVEESNFFQIYHLKDMFLSAELFISCSVLQLTFYVISLSYTRKSGFIILSQQIYHIGFLILLLSTILLCNEELLFQNFISVNDYLSSFSKIVVCVSSLFFIFIIKTSYKDELMKHNFEYVVLVLIGVLGSLLLCSSNDLLTAYLAMELQSVAFYLMAAFKKNSNYSIESGLKYFIVGSFASALFLFGSSFIYGCIGSLNFDDFKMFFPLLFIQSVQSIGSDGGSSVLFSLYLTQLLQVQESSLFNYFVDPLNSIDLLVLVELEAFNFSEYETFSRIDHGFFKYPIWFFLDENPGSFNPIESSDSLISDFYFSLSEYFSHLVYTAPGVTPENVTFIFFHAYPFSIITPTNIVAHFYSFDTLNYNSNSFVLSNIFNEFDNSVYDGFSDVSSSALNLELIYFGFMLVCLSLLIKLAVAPFHYWSLDVYEGSPNQSTFFFAVVPKIGLFVLLVRICYSGFYDFLDHWQFYFLILSLVSIFVGSLGGLEQRKLKSLLAYSSVSHTGYLLLSFSANAMEGIQMMIYYIIIFMLSGLCFWSIYMFLRQKTRNNYYNKQNKELGDLVLLRESNPMLAIALVVTLFSIAGIPPLVGFLAKLGIFLSALSSSTYIIALFSILLSVISTFYYIRVIKIVYFENVLAGKLYHSISTSKAILISILFLSIILLCVYPMILYFTSHKAILLL